jgi:hypothetical protein
MSQLHPFLKQILEICKQNSANWSAEPAVLQNALTKAKAKGDFTAEEVAEVKAAIKARMD